MSKDAKFEVDTLQYQLQRTRQRYRLNNQARVFCKVEGHARRITISSTIYHTLSAKNAQVIADLMNHGYQVIQLIP